MFDYNLLIESIFSKISDRMVSIPMSSQSISSSAVFLAEVADVTRCFDMTGFYVFEYIGFDLSCDKTVLTLPVSIIQFHHL